MLWRPRAAAILFFRHCFSVKWARPPAAHRRIISALLSSFVCASRRMDRSSAPRQGHAANGYCHCRRRSRRLDRRGDARTRRRFGASCRSARVLSARTALREAGRQQTRSAAQDRACGCGLARRHARRRSLGSALWTSWSPEGQRPARHHVRYAGQHHPRANSAGCRDDPRQGDRHHQQRGAAEVTLSTGEEISARLVVLANGLNSAFGTRSASSASVISECHSITIGFDVEPVGRAAFAFPALTYWPSAPRDRAWPTSRCSRSARRCAPTLWSTAT